MEEIEVMSDAEIVNMVRDDIGPFDEKQLKNILEIFPYRLI